MAKQKILIIEDDKSISKLLKYNLEKAGFEAINAYSGEAALEILSRQQPHLIILDIMLPRMDGLEVCRQIRQDKATRKYSHYHADGQRGGSGPHCRSGAGC